MRKPSTFLVLTVLAMTAPAASALAQGSQHRMDDHDQSTMGSGQGMMNGDRGQANMGHENHQGMMNDGEHDQGMMGGGNHNMMGNDHNMSGQDGQ